MGRLKPVRTLLPVSLLVAASVYGAQEPPLLDQAFKDLADLSIEQLLNVRIDRVYGASKYEQKVTQAPASVSIVTADEIKKFGHRNLADVLRSVRGLYVTYDRNYSNFGIRGFDRPGDFNTRVLLLVDGHRMNDNLYDSALIGTESVVDVDLIERVEVIRGPSSSIYGNSAFFGVINVVTRKGGQINGLEVSTEGGSFDGYKERFTYGRQFTNGVEMVLSASFSGTAGAKSLYYREFDSPLTNNGRAQRADAELARKLSASFTYGDFTLSGAYSLREKHVPTASFGTYFNDGREKTTDESFYADLKYQHAFTPDSQLTARVYYDRYSYNADYPLNFGPPAAPFIVIAHDDNYGDGVGGEVQWNQRLFDRHTLIFGGEYREALDLLQSNYNTDPKTYNFQDNRQARTMGAFAQGEAVIRPNLMFNAGVRYDYLDRFGGSVNPRLGLIYNPWEKTTFKALYGQAYRAPNAFELYLQSPGFIKANPDLQPETIRTYELVFEQYLPQNLRFSASGYYYDIKNLISQSVDPADGLLVFQNQSTVKAQGLELELEGKYAHGLLARVSYALQRAEDGQTGQTLNNSPRHLGKLNLSLPVYKEYLYAGLELQYVSGLKTIAGNHTSDALLANATLFSKDVVKNLEFSASIYNLFDTRYAHPGSTGHVQDTIPQDGRSFRVKLTYRF